MANIFISHSHQDKPFVRRLARRLLRERHEPWVDEAEIKGGEKLLNKIADAIHEVDFLVAVLSKTSVESEWVKKELDLAMNREIAEKRVIVIPVLTERAHLPVYLKGKLYIDFGPGADFERSFAKLLEAIGTAKAYHAKHNAVLVVGSALVEDIFTTEATAEFTGRSIELNRKYIVDDRQSFFGGSGVNFSVRLAKTGQAVLPILSAGADESGRKLKAILKDIARDHIQVDPVQRFIEEDGFLCEGLATSRTIVMSVPGMSFTTFTPKLIGIDRFHDHFQERLKKAIDIDSVEVKAVMVGHLYADAPKYCRGRSTITKQLILQYAKKAITFANFGETQLSYGVEYWKDSLKKLSVVQFSIPEVQRFFQKDHPDYSLADIMKWFIKERVCAVVVHDKIGVVATLNVPGGYLTGKVIYLEPAAVDKVADTTGAADAFGAGMVSALMHEPVISCDAFLRALDAGRAWHAFASRIVGASIHSPTAQKIKDFASKLRLNERVDGDVPKLKYLLDLIWKAA